MKDQTIRENIIAEEGSRVLTNFLALFGILTVLPLLIHIQWLTGPIVNAVLILILFIIGKREALIACLVPSMIALASGLLPLVLAPVVPFLMLGNAIFVLLIDNVYSRFKNEVQGYWLGIGAGSFAKFVFIFFCGQIVGRFFLSGKLSIAVVQIVSWPQFVTAFLGGMLAWVILKWLKRI
jgi:hypothetical protein